MCHLPNNICLIFNINEEVNDDDEGWVCKDTYLPIINLHDKGLVIDKLIWGECTTIGKLKQ